MPSPSELASLYDSVAAKQAERGVKGEKAGSIRDLIRAIVAAKKSQGITKLSQATLRVAVKGLLPIPEGKDEAKLDQSYFSTIIQNMYETEKDKATGAVLVNTSAEKPPKVKKERKKKADATISA
jgi:hypothetical protein